jgi:hypothetical protein
VLERSARTEVLVVVSKSPCDLMSVLVLVSTSKANNLLFFQFFLKNSRMIVSRPRDPSQYILFFVPQSRLGCSLFESSKFTLMPG